MKRTLFAFFVLLIAAVSFSGCALGTLQTATTVPEGKVSMFLAATALAVSDIETSTPIPEMGFRMGLSDNIDVGVRLFGLGFMGDIKIALIQNRREGLSLAVTAGVGYSEIGDDASFVAVDLGGIVSIKLGKIITPYLSVKFRSFGFDATGSDDFINNFSGEFIVAGLGFELFPESSVSIILEASKFYDTDGNEAKGLTLVSGGLNFKF